jgi:hypothetical protein
MSFLASEGRLLGVSWPVFGWGLAALGLIIAGVGVVLLGQRLGSLLARRRVTAGVLRSLPPSVRRSLESGDYHSPDAFDVAARPQTQAYLLVVRPGEAQVFTALRDLVGLRTDLARVMWDRRWVGERRVGTQAVGIERRRRERRTPQEAYGELGVLVVTPGGAMMPAVPTLTRPGRAQPERPAREPAPLPRPAVAASERPIWIGSRLAVWALLLVALGVVLIAMLQSREGQLAQRLSSAPGQWSGAVGRSAQPAGRPVVGPDAGQIPDEASASRAQREPVPVPVPSAANPPLTAASPPLTVANPPLTGTVQAPGAPTSPLEQPGEALPAATVPGPGETPAESRMPPSPAPPAETPRSNPGQVASAPSEARPAPSARRRTRAQECKRPSAPVTVRQEGKVLGLWIDVEIDTSIQPSQCLYIVRRPDGSLRALLPGHVELARP